MTQHGIAISSAPPVSILIIFYYLFWLLGVLVAVWEVFVVAHGLQSVGLAALWHVGSFPKHGSNPLPLHWGADS